MSMLILTNQLMRRQSSRLREARIARAIGRAYLDRQGGNIRKQPTAIIIFRPMGVANRILIPGAKWMLGFVCEADRYRTGFYLVFLQKKRKFLQYGLEFSTVYFTRSQVADLTVNEKAVFGRRVLRRLRHVMGHVPEWLRVTVFHLFQ